MQTERKSVAQTGFEQSLSRSKEETATGGSPIMGRRGTWPEPALTSLMNLQPSSFPQISVISPLQASARCGLRLKLPTPFGGCLQGFW